MSREPLPRLALLGLFAVTVLAAQPALPVHAQIQAPPVSADQVAAAIAAAGGPDASGLVRTLSSDHPSSRVFKILLDAEGRPVTKGATHHLRIRLSYMRDGSGGYTWLCTLQVWQYRGRYFELTNAASTMIPSDVWDELMGDRTDWDALNDPETVERIDAMLPRTAADAITLAFTRLNNGQTGSVRLNIR